MKQVSNSTEWLLNAGFTSSTAKIKDLVFSYSGTTTLTASGIVGGSVITSSDKNGVHFRTANNNGGAFMANESMKWTFAGTDLSQFTIAGLQLDGYGPVNYAGVAAPVPEPSTYGMMLAGGLAVAFAVRRRKSNASRETGHTMALTPA